MKLVSFFIIPLVILSSFCSAMNEYKAVIPIDSNDLITTIAKSSDGANVLLGNQNGEIIFCDGSNGQLLKTITAHEREILSVKFSHNESMFVTTSRDNEAILWDSNTIEKKHRLGNFTDDVTEETHLGEIKKVLFTIDDKKLITLACDGALRMWNAETGEFIFRLGGTNFGSEISISNVFIHPDDNATILISINENSTLKMLNFKDIENKKEILSLDLDNDIKIVESSPDGKKILSASKSTFKVSDIETTQEIFCIEKQDEVIKDANFNNSGDRIYIVSVNDYSEYIVEIIDYVNHESLHISHNDIIYSVEFSPDDSKILTASKDNTIKLWDAASGELIDQFNHDGAVYSARFISSYKIISRTYSFENPVHLLSYPPNMLLNPENLQMHLLKKILFSYFDYENKNEGTFRQFLGSRGYIDDTNYNYNDYVKLMIIIRNISRANVDVAEYLRAKSPELLME